MTDQKSCCATAEPASMKVPPKRKGNAERAASKAARERLNESPPEKEGKFGYRLDTTCKLYSLPQ